MQKINVMFLCTVETVDHVPTLTQPVITSHYTGMGKGIVDCAAFQYPTLLSPKRSVPFL